MITDEVIKEIYKTYDKPHKHREELQLEYFIDLLGDLHKIRMIDDDELIVENLEEFNPFRRFLIRGLHGIVEFDRYVAFIFQGHILFFGKEEPTLQVHMRPEKKKRSLWDSIFGGNDDE
ncbi:MAG: hypothetical protein K2M45_04810 [Muribaculaceae bacterium]|nr:hypothetical protein [Muribaculaceae bacterium]